MTRTPLALAGVALLVATIVLGAERTAAAQGAVESTVVCAGTYGGHLQGLATDGRSIYWSHTVQLVKTDLEGNVSRRVDVPSHHGDLTLRGAELFVAVELGEFNQPPGRSDPWVWVYDTGDLSLVSKHRVPELVHGCGGIAWHDGRFIVVGGLPANHRQNYLFEYDDKLRFKGRHILPSGQTHLGIQTAAHLDGRWWFGCYGSPKNPGLLVADASFRLVGRSQADFSYGAARLPSGSILRGAVFAKGRRGKVEVRRDLPAISTVTTIVALGDSITKGVRRGVEPAQTFAALVQKQLRARGHDADVLNLGIGGERTDQALRRLSKVIELRPRIVLAMYGTNDSWVDEGKTASRLALPVYRRHLVEIVDRLRRHGIMPILMTEPRFAENARRNGLGENPNVRLARFVGACRDVAREKNVLLVDHFARWTRAAEAGEDLARWTTDGCHPDPRGHREMGAAIVPELIAAVRAQADGSSKKRSRAKARPPGQGDRPR